jgi:hypothetical protein
MPTEPSRELVIIERATGEIVGVKDASTLSLAAFVTDMQTVREQHHEAEEIVSEELVARMDRALNWTLREGDLRDGEAWEIKAPSPEAGTTVYPAVVLEPELSALIETGVISEEGAETALKRTLMIEVAVPWGTDPDEIALVLQGALGVDIAGHKVDVLSATSNRRVIAAGVNRLSKIPGTKEALDRAVVTREPPVRRAKVTLKTTRHSRDCRNGERGET